MSVGEGVSSLRSQKDRPSVWTDQTLDVSNHKAPTHSPDSNQRQIAELKTPSRSVPKLVRVYQNRLTQYPTSNLVKCWKGGLLVSSPTVGRRSQERVRVLCSAPLRCNRKPRHRNVDEVEPGHMGEELAIQWSLSICSLHMMRFIDAPINLMTCLQIIKLKEKM